MAGKHILGLVGLKALGDVFVSGEVATRRKCDKGDRPAARAGARAWCRRTPCTLQNGAGTFHTMAVPGRGGLAAASRAKRSTGTRRHKARRQAPWGVAENILRLYSRFLA